MFFNDEINVSLMCRTLVRHYYLQILPAWESGRQQFKQFQYGGLKTIYSMIVNDRHQKKTFDKAKKSLLALIKGMIPAVLSHLLISCSFLVFELENILLWW